MRLTMREEDGWYVIERAEHDGRAWIEQVSPGFSALRCSSRFSDADVEGNAEEMLEIARAIKRRGQYAAKRCSVSVDTKTDTVYFRSPRNSQVDGECSLEEADALADEMLALLSGEAG